MSERPLLFLDVDGVLNTLNEEHERLMIDNIPVNVPPGTKERVARLLEVFDPVWATAWLGRAHSGWKRILGLDGLPWPYVNYRDLKLTEILRFAGDRRWAWVDDDALWEFRKLGWPSSHVSGLVIAPLHADGLTDEHVDALLAFASEEAS